MLTFLSRFPAQKHKIGNGAVRSLPERCCASELAAGVTASAQRPQHIILRQKSFRHAYAAVIPRTSAFHQLTEPGFHLPFAGKGRKMALHLFRYPGSQQRNRQITRQFTVESRLLLFFLPQSQIQQRRDQRMKAHIRFVASGEGTAQVLQSRMIHHSDIFPDSRFQSGRHFRQLRGDVKLPHGGQGHQIHGIIGGGVILAHTVEFQISLFQASSRFHRMGNQILTPPSFSKKGTDQDVHQLYVGIHRAYIIQVSGQRAFHRPFHRGVHFPDQLPVQFLRKKLENQREIHSDKFPPVRIKVLPDHRNRRKGSPLIKSFDFPDLFCRIALFPQAPPEKLLNPFLPLIQIISAVRGKMRPGKRLAGRLLFPVVPAEHSIKDILRPAFKLHGKNGVQNGLRPFSVRFRSPCQQSHRIVGARAYPMPLCPVFQQPAGLIILRVHPRHRFIKQPFLLSA